MAIKLKNTLKKLLYEHDLTAAKLARATRIPPQTINNWLSGQTPRNLDQIKAVADYFKMSLDSLVYGVSETMERESTREIIKTLEAEINAGIFEVVLRKVRRQ